ncbi:hypothetical protein KAU93_02735 [Candidatus Bathyarchaeota archaeon]|nr:hypothetical protein [Candidatus Bathyarchaeota archaeon]
MRVIFNSVSAVWVFSFLALTAIVESHDLPNFFSGMIAKYECSADVKTLVGSVVFNMTAQYTNTILEVKENASIHIAFNVTSANGELPREVHDVFFPFQLESYTSTIEVPLEKPEPFYYWPLYLDEGDLAEYKVRDLFVGEENFDTVFASVGTYHMRRAGTYSTYDIFFDKATGLLVFVEERYGGGGEIQNYIVNYSMEAIETNASFSPPIPSTFPHLDLVLIGILLATVLALSVIFTLKKRKANNP